MFLMLASQQERAKLEEAKAALQAQIAEREARLKQLASSK
jgi:hypothetical protein